MFNLFGKTQDAFGLDVSTSSVHIVQFRGTPKSLSVQAFAQVPLTKGVVTGDEVTDSKAFSQAVDQAMHQPQYGSVSSRYAVVNIPEAKAFVRVIQIPVMTETEAESAVPVESENFIPLPIDQVYLDWQILGTDGDKMNVLIVAAPREYVDRYIEILERAGVQVAALEVESQSCHRALVDWSSGPTALIVDLAANHTNLIVVEDGNLHFTSTIPVAGNAFTEAIARSLGVASVKAEAVKRKVGFTNTAEYPNVKTALEPVLNVLASEVKNVASFYREHAGREVATVLLTGGSARLTGLAEFLQAALKPSGISQVLLADPWRNVPGLRQRPFDAQESLNFTTAIGLALRGVNFAE